MWNKLHFFEIIGWFCIIKTIGKPGKNSPYRTELIQFIENARNYETYALLGKSTRKIYCITEIRYTKKNRNNDGIFKESIIMT